jgi:hypothetical protein
MPDLETLVHETRVIAARTEAKVDLLLERTSDHEQRIRSAERWRWGIPGGLIVALLSLFGLNQ